MAWSTDDGPKKCMEFKPLHFESFFFARVFFALKTCVGGQDVMMQFMVEMDRNPRTLKKEVLARRGESAFAVLNFFSFLKGRPA